MTRLIIHLVSRSLSLFFSLLLFFYLLIRPCTNLFLLSCLCLYIFMPLSFSISHYASLCLSVSFFLSVSFLVSVCLYDSLIPLCLRNWMSDCHNAFYPSIYTITTNNYIYIACSSKLFESKFIDIPQHHKKHCFDVEHAWKTVLRRKVRNRTVRTTS